MRKNLNKFAKGMFGIIMIKLLFIGGASLFQACQEDEGSFETFEQQVALDKFESLVKETTPKIQSVIVDRQNHLLARSANSDAISMQTEEEAKEALKPLIEGSKELFTSYGISEADFLEELEPEDPRIVLLGLALLSTRTNDTEVAIDLTGLLGTKLYATKIADCAADAVGVTAVMELFKGKVSKAVLKKAIRKIAKRALGPIGVAWAVYDFFDCMGGLIE